MDDGSLPSAVQELRGRQSVGNERDWATVDVRSLSRRNLIRGRTHTVSDDGAPPDGVLVEMVRRWRTKRGMRDSSRVN